MNPSEELEYLEESLADAYAELAISIGSENADLCYREIAEIKDDINQWWEEYGEEYAWYH